MDLEQELHNSTMNDLWNVSTEIWLMLFVTDQAERRIVQQLYVKANDTTLLVINRNTYSLHYKLQFIKFITNGIPGATAARNESTTKYR